MAYSITKEENYYSDIITFNTFVNPDFQFYSQITDADILEKGLDQDDTLENLERYFQNILNSLMDYPTKECKKLSLTPSRQLTD